MVLEEVDKIIQIIIEDNIEIEDIHKDKIIESIDKKMEEGLEEEIITIMIKRKGIKI
jgi:hypothetical protein